MELADDALANVMTGKEPVVLDGYRLGWRAVKPDLRSKNGFRYPWPGNWAEAPGPIIESNKGPCPSAIGDGLCVAKTFAGAVQGGIPLGTLLLVGFLPADVLGEDEQKVRVRRMWVSDILDIAEVLPRICANLWGADLWGADLRGADLGGADLGGANLWGANLRGADLRGANLWGADLGGANLRGANLRGANLWGANLRGADPWGADLGGADLRGARYSQQTLWPDGFNPKKAGAVGDDA